MDIYIDYSLIPGVLPGGLRSNDVKTPEFWQSMEEMMNVTAPQAVDGISAGNRGAARAADQARRQKKRAAARAAAERMRRSYLASGEPYALSFNSVMGRFL